MRIIQELTAPRTGAVWSMKFSLDGRLLATGGQVRFSAHESSFSSQTYLPFVHRSKCSFAPYGHAFEMLSESFSARSGAGFDAQLCSTLMISVNRLLDHHLVLNASQLWHYATDEICHGTMPPVHLHTGQAGSRMVRRGHATLFPGHEGDVRSRRQGPAPRRPQGPRSARDRAADPKCPCHTSPAPTTADYSFPAKPHKVFFSPTAFIAEALAICLAALHFIIRPLAVKLTLRTSLPDMQFAQSLIHNRLSHLLGTRRMCST